MFIISIHDLHELVCLDNVFPILIMIPPPERKTKGKNLLSFELKGFAMYTI